MPQIEAHLHTIMANSTGPSDKSLSENCTIEQHHTTTRTTHLLQEQTYVQPKFDRI